MTDFEQIYRTYFSDVFLYIRRLSNSEQIAEEITSDTFCKAMQSIDRFRGECDMRVWLCQIAKNSYYTYLKKAKRAESMDDADLINLSPSGESLEERFFKKDHAMQIRKILHDISDPYKEVFMWRVFAELSFRQIGGMFHKSENWACVTYHRAKKMIQIRLEEIEYEDRL